MNGEYQFENNFTKISVRVVSDHDADVISLFLGHKKKKTKSS